MPGPDPLAPPRIQAPCESARSPGDRRNDRAKLLVYLALLGLRQALWCQVAEHLIRQIAHYWQGGLTATRHLIELGHRRIAAIGGPSSLWSSRARVDGYRAAMLEAGLPVEDSFIRRDVFSVDGARRQAMELLSMADRPTGIVTGSDAQAFGVLQALGQLRLRAHNYPPAPCG